MTLIKTTVTHEGAEEEFSTTRLTAPDTLAGRSTWFDIEFSEYRDGIIIVTRMKGQVINFEQRRATPDEEELAALLYEVEQQWRKRKEEATTRFLDLDALRGEMTDEET